MEKRRKYNIRGSYNRDCIRDRQKRLRQHNKNKRKDPSGSPKMP